MNPIKFTRAAKGSVYAYTSTAGRFGLKYRYSDGRVVVGWEVWDVRTRMKIGTARNLRGAADVADHYTNYGEK